MSVVRRETIAGIPIPDSALAREATELVREAAPPLLFDHSRRVFLWASLQGERHGLDYDPELLYVGAMFHDVGLLEGHRSEHERFEIDGANAARRFLEAPRPPGAAGDDRVGVDRAAHHAGDPALQAARGAARDARRRVRRVGPASRRRPAGKRAADRCPRTPARTSRPASSRAFYEGMRYKPETTFGTMNTDVLEELDPGYLPTELLPDDRGRAVRGVAAASSISSSRNGIG